MVNLDSTWKYRLSELANYRTIHNIQNCEIIDKPELARRKAIADDHLLKSKNWKRRLKFLSAWGTHRNQSLDDDAVCSERSMKVSTIADSRRF
jgi:hypothetical protein